MADNIVKAEYLKAIDEDTNEEMLTQFIPPAPSDGDLGGISEEQLAQISELKEDIDNLIPPELIDNLEKGYFNRDGSVTDSEYFFHTTYYYRVAFIDSLNMPIYKSGFFVLYDIKKNIIDSIDGTGNFSITDEYFEDTSKFGDAYFVRFTIVKNIISKYHIEHSVSLNGIEYRIDDASDRIDDASDRIDDIDFDIYNYEYDTNINYMVAEEYATTNQGIHISQRITKNVTILNRDTNIYGGMWYRSPLKETNHAEAIKIENFTIYNKEGLSIPSILFLDKYERIIDYYLAPLSPIEYVLNTEEVKVPYRAAFFCVQTANIANGSNNSFANQKVYLSAKKISKLNELSDRIDDAKSDWNNKKCAFIGDSITFGVGTTKTYYQYMKDIINIMPFVYAQSGAHVSGMLEFAKNLYKENPDMDAIFILGGTNDYNANVPLGDFFTETTEQVNVNGSIVERKMRTLSNSTSTFRGRLNNLIGYLKTSYPDSQIILMTPLHRGYAKLGDNNIQPPENYANGLDLYIDDYVDAVKESGEIWSCPVIDLFSDSGLYPLSENYYKYFNNKDTDRLHPNALGHQRMAKTIIKNLNGIPCDLKVN